MQLATLACALIVSNMFGPQGLSKFGIVQTTITTIASVLPFGLGYTAINYINKNRDDGFGLLVANFAYQTCLVVSLITAVLLISFSSPISRLFYSDESLAIYVVLAGIGLPFAAISFIQHSLLNGFEAYADMARAAYISATATVVLVGAGAFVAGLSGAIYGFVLTLVIRAALLQWSLGRHCSIEYKLPSREIWRKVRNFAVPVGLAGLSLTPAIWFANSLLIKHEGLEAQGVMMAVLTIRMAISFVVQQLSTVLFPKYIQASHESDREHYRRIFVYFSIMTTMSFMACLMTFVFRNPLMSLFGEDFKVDDKLLLLILMSVIFEASATIFSHTHARLDKMWRFTLLYSYPKDVFFVLCCIFLIPIYSSIGMAISYFAANLFGLVVVSASAVIAIKQH